MLTVAVGETLDAERCATLDELVAGGARRMLAAALEAEVSPDGTKLFAVTHDQPFGPAQFRVVPL